MNVPAKLEVCSFSRSWDNRGYPKIGDVPGHAHTTGGHTGSGMVPFERALASSYRPSIRIIPLSALICPTFRLHFWVRVANPQSRGWGGRMWSAMIAFERSLVSSYRPSIVTFPLSLRVSKILLLLFSRTPLFPYPTSSLPNISPMIPWE